MALAFASLALHVLLSNAEGQYPLQPASFSEFDWDKARFRFLDGPSTAANNGIKTPAHKHFKWHDCYNNFKCARLEVPMDWLGTSKDHDKTVEIAVIKVEATVPVTDASYGGAVVLNPGGPGGSGIGQVLRGGHHVRTILSADPGAEKDTAKHFDIIGFDPRGVNNTRPLVSCFPNQNDAAIWQIEQQTYGYMGVSNTSFDNLWASQRALAEGCSKRLAEEGIANHVATASVARDIVEIFERHGEWREAEARRLLESASGSGHSERTKKILEKTAYTAGKEMIQYWGFSYGTILGSTLSATYPERIKRAVLDGVADVRDYMQGRWSRNLIDTDRILVKLSEYCFDAGAKNCALYDAGGPAAIGSKIETTLEEFRSNPKSVPANGTHPAQAVTYNDFKLLVRDMVYNPVKLFPLTARVLDELSKNSAPSLAAWKEERRPRLTSPAPNDQCEKDGPYSPSCFLTDKPDNAGAAISCTDGLSRTKETKAEYRAYASAIMSQSQLIGSYWADIQLPCTAWHARPHWRYEGDFTARTAHPILFVGNTIDPVTPLVNAFEYAKGFEGAGVLHQDAEGHCTYTAASLCSGRALRRYFQTGALPGKLGGLSGWEGFGQFCSPDRVPFDGFEEDEVPPLPEGEDDEELWEALVRLGQVWP